MLYTFFDVETPNRRNDRICSIGAVVTDQDGTVVENVSCKPGIELRRHQRSHTRYRPGRRPQREDIPGALVRLFVRILPGRRRGCTQRAVRSQRLDQNTGLI